MDAGTALAKLRGINEPIKKYLFLRDLKLESHDAYHRILRDHVHEVLPFVYTPTVGEACQQYHRLPLQTWGVYISYNDSGRILDKLRDLPDQDVSVIVVTDGEHILGLGDLGAGGMGISEGKIMLYTAAAGVDPTKCLPMCLDVGTNNDGLLEDPEYHGLKRKRVTGEEYQSFCAEFVDAVKAWQPNVVLQFEDFANDNAFWLLETYKDQLCCFNDDIQGTACICLAGLYSAMRVTQKPLKDQVVLFFGAGKAGIGMAELIAMAVQKTYGGSREEARRSCFFMDSHGLVCKERSDLPPHKQTFAHDVPFEQDLVSAIHALKPTALVGVSTVASAFNKEVIEAMCEENDRPLIFPLSNPTSKSECTFEQALNWGGGRVLFASGSPFDPIERDGTKLVPSQANNAYVFPAVGHAAVLAQASHLPDDVFMEAAKALADIVTEDEVKTGALFPSFDYIMDVNKKVMAKLGQYMETSGLGKKPHAMEWDTIVDKAIWQIPTA